MKTSENALQVNQWGHRISGVMLMTIIPVSYTHLTLPTICSV